MMDKKFYAIAVSAICAMNVYAGPVDVNKAQTMARKFIGNPVSVGPSVVKSRGPRTSEPSLHLFNNQDGEGFVIVAGDDRVGGVLGYSDRGRLDAENMSAPMKQLLERYARVVELEKDRLPGGEFLQAIYQELSLGCPVFMTGGDHAFLYDGYDENGLVHVNWGWAGLDNGYFDINTAATAGGGYGSDGCYYENQIALFVHPNDGMIEPQQPKPVVLSVNNDQGLQFQASEEMTVKSVIPAQIKGVGARNVAQDAGGAYTGQIGIGLFTQDGKCMHVFGQSGVLTWATYYTSYNFEYDWWRMDLNEIDGLADGTYTLRPLGRRLLDADKGVWENWRQMVNGNSVPMIVNRGEVTLVQADNKPHLLLAGKPEVLEPAYQYSSQLAGILLNVSNLSRYQARGELQVELEGTGNLAGETYQVPNAYLIHMVAQRMDTTQWLVRFMTSYSGPTGSHELKAGKYRMKLRFNHNIETKNPGVYEIAVPEDFLLEVYPNNYEGRVTVTSVKLLDEAGSYVPSHYFDLDQKPQLVLGMSGYMKYLTQGSLQTRMRYRLVNVATGETAYTSSISRVSIPRNNDTDLTGSTRHTVNLSELAEGTYEIHVDIERDGMWMDRWNANTLRRRITLYRKAPTTGITKPALSQGTGSAAASSSSGAVYGLDGRKLTKVTQPGIYIRNGKKVVMRK